MSKERIDFGGAFDLFTDSPTIIRHSPLYTVEDELRMELNKKDAIIREFRKKAQKIDMPEKYIINETVTILFWKNGEKTMIRRCKDDEFNPRLAFLTALFQHYCGMSKNKANKYLASLEVEETKETETKRTKVKK